MARENNAVEAQETPKQEKVYKVTCGAFKARNEALQSAAEVKRAGINAVIEIGKEGYSILCVDGVSKAMAETVRKEIEAKGIKAIVSEQK